MLVPADGEMDRTAPTGAQPAVRAAMGAPRLFRLSLRTLPAPGWGHRPHSRAAVAVWA